MGPDFDRNKAFHRFTRRKRWGSFCGISGALASVLGSWRLEGGQAHGSDHQEKNGGSGGRRIGALTEGETEPLGR